MNRRYKNNEADQKLSYDDDKSRDNQDKKIDLEDLKSSYWFTRIIFLRYLGFIYLVAFLVAYEQNEFLIGNEGLTPAKLYISDINANLGSSVPLYAKFFQLPTFFWWIEPSSQNLNYLSALGALLSLIPIVFGSANSIIMLTLWLLYMSIVNVGQTWYSFGWESQLLESGFLAIFMVPFFSLLRFPQNTPTPYVTIWGYRWLLFRIMLGAGLIKIRGDSCWRDLTCMQYHYQTQPVPNPLSPLFHASPERFHTFETFGNHIIELVIPWFLFLPRTFRVACGHFQIAFQIVLILSGNLSFLNWLTIAPAIMYYDDYELSFLFKKELIEKNILMTSVYKNTIQTLNKNLSGSLYIYLRRIISLCLTVLLIVLSIPVVKNLMSPHQAMNTSFDSFRIVNTYGAFGSITRVRTEVILQGTVETDINSNTIWKDYNFKCKPGDINRVPCFISPWHYRIDWLLWFAAFQDYQNCPWIVHLAKKLLNKDKNVLSNIASDGNPFAQDQTPNFIRALHYEYQYNLNKLNIGTNNSNEKGWEVGTWWKRMFLREYMPPISLKDESVDNFLKHFKMMK